MPQILVTTTGTRILQHGISFKIKRGKLASKTKSSIISKVDQQKKNLKRLPPSSITKYETNLI